MEHPFAHTRFHAASVGGDWPYPTMVGVETRDDPAYRLVGRTRSDRPHCAFQFTLSGMGWYRDATGDCELPTGTGFLCDSLDPAVEYGYPQNGRTPWRFVFVTMTGATTYELVRMLRQQHGPLWTLPLTTPVIQRLIGLAGHGGMREIEQPPSGGYQLVSELLAVLLATTETAKNDRAGSVLLRRVRELVENDRNDTLQVGELAAKLAVSREHLTRVFQQQMGFTPAHYLAQRRILRGCEWLRDTSMTVKEISWRLGFSAPHHFVRMFRRVLGVTPGKFRENGSPTPVL